MRKHSLRNSKLSSSLLTLGLMIYGNLSYSTSCTVSTTSINFGNYDVFSATPLDTTATVSVTCSPTATSYTVALERGLYGPINNRRMKSSMSQSHLNYNLYTDAARSIIWGNGTANTSTVSSSSSSTHTVYGRIDPNQSVSVGSYSDSVTVTVTFN